MTKEDGFSFSLLCNDFFFLLLSYSGVFIIAGCEHEEGDWSTGMKIPSVKAEIMVWRKRKRHRPDPHWEINVCRASWLQIQPFPAKLNPSEANIQARAAQAGTSHDCECIREVLRERQGFCSSQCSEHTADDIARASLMQALHSSCMSGAWGMRKHRENSCALQAALLVSSK